MAQYRGRLRIQGVVHVNPCGEINGGIHLSLIRGRDDSAAVSRHRFDTIAVLNS